MKIKLNKKNVNSLIMALYLCLFYINAIVGIDGIGIITLACVFVLFFISLANRWIEIGKAWVIIVAYIFFLFSFSILKNEINSLIIEYLFRFISYGIIGILIGMQDIDIEYVIKTIICIAVTGSLLMLRKGYTWFLIIDPTHGVAMGLSYALLPLIIAALMGLKYCLRWKLLSFYLLCVISLFYLKISPRGVLLAVGVFILITVYYNVYVRNHQSNIALFPFLAIIGGTVGLTCFVTNIALIVTSVSEFLDSEFNMRIFALDKLIYYLEKGDVSNNRFDLWKKGWDFAKNHPLTGNGIGYFEMKNDTYTHNIFLQSMNEGGVIMLIPICVIFAFVIFWMLFIRGSKVTREQYFFAGLLFVSGAFPLIYSSVYWIMNPFWVFLGYVIVNIKFKSKKVYL